MNVPHREEKVLGTKNPSTVDLSGLREAQVESCSPCGTNVPDYIAVSCAKTAEVIDLPFGLLNSDGPKEAKVQSYSPMCRHGGTLASPGQYY